MANTWLSLLPPLIVIVTVLITRKLNFSLLVGIISAALIASQANILQTSTLIAQHTWEHLSDIDNLYLYTFLIAISSIITVLTHTGSATACARIISRRVRSKRTAETSSILLSFLMSIDDYLSILTVGFVMRSLADRVGVARNKLAFLVHSLAGSVVIMTPISSWAAAILAQLDQAGISADTMQNSKIAADPFFIYLKTFPFMFYSLLMITSVWFIVRKQLSFGPLYQQEKSISAKKLTHEEHHAPSKHQHSLIELLLPLGLLLGGIIVGLLYTGGYHFFGGANSFVDAFRYNQKTFLVMCTAGCISFFVSCALALCKQMLTLREVPRMVIDGFLLMQGAILMVVLASILGTFLRIDLMTGTYLANLLLGSVPFFLLPLMIFVTSLIITLATGSAWGTFALMLPIVIQMLVSMFGTAPPVNPETMSILFPALGAIFSGAVCGDHISPFSETTIMTATSTGTTPLGHAYSQFPYAVPALISTLISFLIAGLLSHHPWWVNFGISIGTGISICLILLFVLNKSYALSKRSD